jgi:hypothetical protein
MSLTGYVFGLYDAVIAPWSSPQTWGTSLNVGSVDLMNVDFDTVNGILHGNDQINDVHAKVISAKCKLRIAFNDLAVWACLSGETVVNSDPTAEAMVFGATNRPYFGLAGRIDQTQGGGDLQIFIPKLKIIGPISYAAEYGKYITPEMEATGVKDSTVYGFGKLIKHATATTVQIPIV